jgi:hypothetical protein
MVDTHYCMPTDELIGTIDPFDHPIPRLITSATISSSARGCCHKNNSNAQNNPCFHIPWFKTFEDHFYALYRAHNIYRIQSIPQLTTNQLEPSVLHLKAV